MSLAPSGCNSSCVGLSLSLQATTRALPSSWRYIVTSSILFFFNDTKPKFWSLLFDKSEEWISTETRYWEKWSIHIWVIWYKTTYYIPKPPCEKYIYAEHSYSKLFALLDLIEIMCNSPHSRYKHRWHRTLNYFECLHSIFWHLFLLFISKITISKFIDNSIINTCHHHRQKSPLTRTNAKHQEEFIHPFSIVFRSTSFVSYVVSSCSNVEQLIIRKQISEYPEWVRSESNLSIGKPKHTALHYILMVLGRRMEWLQSWLSV